MVKHLTPAPAGRTVQYVSVHYQVDLRPALIWRDFFCAELLTQPFIGCILSTSAAQTLTENTMSKVTNHRNFNADDFAYLTAKGWTEAEILARWDIEQAPVQWTGATARAKLASTTGLRGTYQFQLTSGEMFTVSAGDVRSAWIAAVTFLADAGQLDGMAELTLVKVS